jgi:hypothetical protein
MLEGFLDAYRRWDPRLDHRLAVILNGFRGAADRRLADVDRLLESVEHERFVTPSAVPDLIAYRLAAQYIDARELCFLNSYSRPLVDGWLAKLAHALAPLSVGLVGSGGSCESAYTAAPFWLRRRRKADFPPFPNPHLRSNGFMLARELLLELEWPALRSKATAWALESGKHSIARQAWERGLEVLVVGRDGVAYPPERWRQSATFRSGDQRNLLIADNRTRQFEEAEPALRARLEEMAWGDSGEPASSVAFPRAPTAADRSGRRPSGA